MTGLTFALDVPRVANGAATLDRMVALAGKFADALIGEVVDDNRKPLTASGLAIIKKTLTGIGVTMEKRGIVPGSPAAKRLFS
jgi:FtsZ-interacting cell division protein ZipA